MLHERISDSEYLDLKNSVKESVLRHIKPIKFVIFYYEELSAIGIEGRQELPPLGVLYFAAALHEVGIQVSVIPFTDEYVSDSLDNSTDFIGYSITSSIVYPHYKALSEKIKLLCPDAITLAGNTHASLFPEEVLADLRVDGVLCGESEYSILILLRNYLSTNSRKYLFNEVPGSYATSQYRSSNRKTVQVSNISLLPHPYREALEDKYVVLANRIKVAGSENVQAVTFITSRGCPYNCYFCANMNNGSVRLREKVDMDAEIQQIQKRYPTVGGLIIMDETATLSREHVKNWTQVMKNHSIEYVLSTRGDAIDSESVLCLASSGCKEIKFGLESGSPKLLSAMNKKLDLNSFEKTLVLTKQFGINNKVFLMHGFPGENRETTQQTIEFLNKNRQYIDRAVLYQFAPLPGSYVYTAPDKFGIKRDILTASNFTIYNNMTHCWGSQYDYDEMINAYNELKSFVESTFRR